MLRNKMFWCISSLRLEKIVTLISFSHSFSRYVLSFINKYLWALSQGWVANDELHRYYPCPYHKFHSGYEVPSAM